MARILVCDDEEGMRTFVARALQLEGHMTVQAEDGAHALEILTADESGFDLLLTDIRMPVMDGIALALNVARDFPKTTILLMTGFADQRERACDLDAIIHDVVTKPFTLAEIRLAAKSALRARSAYAA
jgi:CheY-like chemotaxis protein